MVTKAVTFASLTSMAGSEEKKAPFGSEAGVSRQLAARRSARLSDVRYALSLQLTGSARPGGVVEPLAQLEGTARISFRQRIGPHMNDPLLLDFRDLQSCGGKTELTITDGAIGSVEVNGRPLEHCEQLNGHLIIPAAALREGENEALIDFVAPIAASGRPLICFDDPTNGDRFVYLLPVPMDASLAYPCFDQPDLKGRFSLSITVPAGLEVISNTAPDCIEPAGPALTRYRFAETPPLSTYLFSFAVGRFACLEAELDRLPLRLFVRRSQLERAAAEWPAIQALTASGIRALVQYLDHPFPFSKYDQVLLPGFPFRGMEHAGATYLREESILFPSQPTRADRHARTTLILHELVHQWFGDLVTMRWFDDLWIKEGFANYLAYLTMATIANDEAGRLDVWKLFHLHHKPAAYLIDSSSGTTPIHQQVPNLNDAKSAYGAIVYQKAPTVLRALSFKLGAEVFRAGVQLFLQRHAFSNADWRDLIASFEEVSGLPLGEWASAWIGESGMPIIETSWDLLETASRRLQITLRQSDQRQPGRCWPIETRVRIAFTEGATQTIR
ncbi:MAG: M1 family metallopeptidase, partial [Acidobacteriota bacterium]